MRICHFQEPLAENRNDAKGGITPKVGEPLFIQCAYVPHNSGENEQELHFTWLTIDFSF